ncbi:DUF3991 and TOPRIM domain-containing protein [Paenibacillus sp. V4I9]|uniref:DUF3991 and TOPRIM domain-containing protein n=1 Tax=Paenibacillus sp. V4I9 TaxID=3042308 RepID=UPI0027D7EA75|nr:DUF3991 and TOPRIM domain-containing protein [Paenibacillus sp. V4I9]
MKISIENKMKARRASLVDFCQRNNYDLNDEGDGNYRVIGYAGTIIKDNMFYRHSTQEQGSAIDFCMNILGMGFKDAVEGLLEVDNYVEDLQCDRLRQSLAKQQKRVGFGLPYKAENTMLFPYLFKTRRIPLKIVKEIIQSNLLYQDDRSNCVFPCYDSLGIPRGAIIRGTHKDIAFKNRVEGSDMGYGWVINSGQYSNEVVVVEAPIDAMSFMALFPEISSNTHFLALGGLHFGAISTFLKENKQVAKVILALDNDSPAKEFVEKAKTELEVMYGVEVLYPEIGKDWNEVLTKKQRRVI